MIQTKTSRTAKISSEFVFVRRSEPLRTRPAAQCSGAVVGGQGPVGRVARAHLIDSMAAAGAPERHSCFGSPRAERVAAVARSHRCLTVLSGSLRSLGPTAVWLC